MNEKKNIDSAKCAIEMSGGNSKMTVIPPRSPWPITSPAATQPRRRSWGVLSGIRQIIRARMQVSRPTSVATTRCVCSYSTPSVISGIKLP